MPLLIPAAESSFSWRVVIPVSIIAISLAGGLLCAFVYFSNGQAMPFNGQRKIIKNKELALQRKMSVQKADTNPNRLEKDDDGRRLAEDGRASGSLPGLV